MLQNKTHQKIIVFEKDLELLFLALNLSDFSEDLASRRLIITLNKDMNPIKALQLFTSNVFALLYRSYFLELHCDYYEKQKKDILRPSIVSTKTPL